MDVCKIGQVCDLNPKTDINLPLDAQISFIPMNAVSVDGKITLSKTVLLNSIKNYTVFQNGDILFAKITPCMENGKGAVAESLINGYGAGSTEFIILRPNTEIVTQKWIQLFLSQKTFRLHCQQHMTGTAGQKRVPAKFLANCDIPTPTLSEQKRIVSRIEELFSQLDASVAELKIAKERLKVYRQAVYHDVMNSFESKKYILSDVVTTIEGDRGKNYPKREDFQSDGACLFLTAQNVRPYGWRFESNTFISAKKDRMLRSGKLQRNDIVITTRGTLGNVAVYDESVPYENMRVNSCMLILRMSSNIVSPYYLALFLMSPIFKAQIDRLKSGTAQPQIPANVLRSTIINIPSLPDQKKIIVELSGLFSVCDSIEKTVDTALQQAEALRQSILKKAFEGGL